MTHFTALLASASLVLSASALAPAAHAQNSASLHGRVLDAAGRPGSHAVIRLVSDTTATPSVHPLRYTLIGDALGKFRQEGIAPGAYLVMLFTDGKGTDVLERISLRPGDDTVLRLMTGSHEVQVAETTSRMAARLSATMSIK